MGLDDSLELFFEDGNNIETAVSFCVCINENINEKGELVKVILIITVKHTDAYVKTG